MRFSIYAVLGIGPYSCFMQQFSHIMRFLVKIIVHKILVIFILHLCYSCIMRFFLGNKKRVNGELSVHTSFFLLQVICLSGIFYEVISSLQYHNPNNTTYLIFVNVYTLHFTIYENLTCLYSIILLSNTFPCLFI